MDRLISADALMREVETCISNNKQLIDEWFANVITDAIDEQPTVDAEPVVRCKECNWFERNNTKKGEVLYCYYHEINIKEDDFCSWGERKEDETC